jgi:pimeloyl-ACP methyl ester carboxylesterase
MRRTVASVDSRRTVVEKSRAMERLARGDVEIAYEVEGQGEPLVLVMGLGGDHHAWDLLRPLLRRRHRLVLVDNRDAGESSEARGSYALADMAADALAVVDRLGIDRFHLLGASMGGAIAQHVALAAPQRVASMMLLGTWARTDAFLRAILDAWRALVGAVPAELFVLQQLPWLYGPRTLQEPPAEVTAWQEAARARGLIKSAGAMQRQIDACLAHDLADVLIMLRTPTLVMVGEDDILVPPRHSRHVVSCLFTAEYQALAAAGHAAFLETPKPLAERVLRFAERWALTRAERTSS